MLQEVIDLQKEAVANIISQLNIKDNITFKSPTGSGKTYMMADVMDKIISQNSDIIFLVSSLSKGELAQQNEDKFEEYVKNKIFNHINPYLISNNTGKESRLYIPTDYNVYVLPRDLYKRKSKLKSGGALINFLDVMTKPSPFGMGKKIFLIKDESHITTTNLDNLKEKYFTKTINCSATPKFKNKTDKPDVQITEESAVSTKLIKKVVYGGNDENLEFALDKFKKVKEQYQEASLDKSFGKMVNPCLIIQISNKNKANEEIDGIKRLLNETKYQDLQWMLIVDNDKECDTNTILKKIPVSKWKEEAKKQESTIDIIIFKMVITEGWDIPRACMLYQMRDSQSEQLDEQVIGRVRRNPKLVRFEKLTNKSKELVTTAYVWGIVDKETKGTREVTLVSSQVQDEFKLKTTRLKRPIENISFDIKEYLNNQSKPIVPDSIFELYSKYCKVPSEISALGDSYITDIPTWFNFNNNIDNIIKKSKNITCDYDKNMELVVNEDGSVKNVTLPLLSYYTDNGNYINIGKGLWKRVDDKEDFSFDSLAEREWFEILLGLINEDAPIGNTDRVIKHINVTDLKTNEIEKKYLVGKNYLPNSEIKFEYYLYGIHSSYPDFIMKDYQNRIHLFESKSLNGSSRLFNKEDYEEKVNALKSCYLAASKLTGYYFYLPIKKEEDWTIFQYFNGIEKTMSKKDFLSFMIK